MGHVKSLRVTESITSLSQRYNARLFHVPYNLIGAGLSEHYNSTPKVALKTLSVPAGVDKEALRNPVGPE